MTESELLEAARKFLTDKLEINGMKTPVEWYPRVDVQLAWVQEFAASVTQSQAAESARYRKALELIYRAMREAVATPWN